MQVESPPTKEWLKHQRGNQMRHAEIKRTGGEVEGCYMLAFRTPYDVLASLDVLAGDYLHTVDMLWRASEGFRGRSISNGDGNTGEGAEIRQYWLMITREIPKRDANYLAWLGSDIEGDIAALKWGFYQTAPQTERLLQQAQKIALDFMREFRNN